MNNKRKILANWIKAYKKLGNKTMILGLLELAKYSVEYQRPPRTVRESTK